LPALPPTVRTTYYHATLRDASEVSVTERWKRCLKMMLSTGDLLPRSPRSGELPEVVQGPLNVPGQSDWIQGVPLRRECLLLLGREPAGGEHPLRRPSASPMQRSLFSQG
jgi:hypothetical protein